MQTSEKKMMDDQMLVYGPISQWMPETTSAWRAPDTGQRGRVLKASSLWRAVLVLWSFGFHLPTCIDVTLQYHEFLFVLRSVWIIKNQALLYKDVCL